MKRPGDWGVQVPIHPYEYCHWGGSWRVSWSQNSTSRTAGQKVSLSKNCNTSDIIRCRRWWDLRKGSAKGARYLLTGHSLAGVEQSATTLGHNFVEDVWHHEWHWVQYGILRSRSDETRTSHQLLSTKLRLAFLGEQLQPPTKNAIRTLAITIVFSKALLIILKPGGNCLSNILHLKWALSFAHDRALLRTTTNMILVPMKMQKETMTTIPKAWIRYRTKSKA